MCGVAGFWDFNRGFSDEQLEDITKKMLIPISTRGPDSQGVWKKAYSGVALGHTRLSILDLSQKGQQPMSFQNLVLSYNGEIYNSPDIRQDLECRGIQFNGTSDTEVLIKAIAYWGLEKALSFCVGMFAFALWDSQKETMTFVRDRLGKKPLYWGIINNTLFFGSSLKSFIKHPQWNGIIDSKSLQLYFKYINIPAPYTIFKDMNKLEPGQYVIIGADKKVEKKYYWSIDNVLEKRKVNYSSSSVQDLKEILQESIRQRTLSDVPIGAFLSGGIDSSLVVAMLQEQSSSPINTYSIGFDNQKFNEAHYAKKIANFLGTNHTELYLKPNEIIDKIPSILTYFDEPFADSSQIPTYFVSDLAKKEVKVVLSGDGGDELFVGYNRYFMGQKLWNYLSYCPDKLRPFFGNFLKILNNFVGFNKLDTLSNFFPLKEEKIFYDYLVSNKRTHNILKYYDPKLFLHEMYSDVKSSRSFIEKMQFWDIKNYLPNDILNKVDRSSMAVSLEARTPMLDHRVVEFAWNLSINEKYEYNKPKRILYSLLSQYLPLELYNRPKMGFGVPINEWLRGSLKSWAHDTIIQLKSDPHINFKALMTVWKEHQNKIDNSNILWPSLVYQQWKNHMDITN